jgi:hypothetical protein
MSFPRLQKKNWSIACSGELGDSLNWDPKYGSIAAVYNWFMATENLPPRKAKKLIASVTEGCPYFDRLRLEFNNNQLYRLSNFEFMFEKHFLYLQCDDEDADWVKFRIYIRTPQEEEVIREFDAMWKRLEGIDPTTGEPQVN